MSKRKKTPEITYSFFTVKSKLRGVVTSSGVTDKMNRVVILAHDIFKRATLFLRAYCLHTEPPVTLSTIRHCMCSRDSRGRRPMDDILEEDMHVFWKLHFSNAYPDLLEGKGLSGIKQLLVEQILSCILTDVKTHLKSRLARLIHFLLK